MKKTVLAVVAATAALGAGPSAQAVASPRTNAAPNCPAGSICGYTGTN